MGVYASHFGHFLVETTSRLWAIKDSGPIDGIVMLMPAGQDRERVQRVVNDFFQLCGLSVPEILWTETPVRIESLIVPQQACGAEVDMLGAPEYRAFMRGHFGVDIAPSGSSKLFISRTALTHRRGTLIDEPEIEQLLAAEGYEIFHPQDHSMEEQIARYKAATMIIGVDGSPFHLVALCADSDLRVAIIQRRPAPDGYWQAKQIRLFSGAAANLIPADPYGWSPAGTKRSAKSLFGTISVRAAGEKLAALGMIERPELWSDAKPEDRIAAIQEIGKRFRRDMYQVRKPHQSLAHLPLRQDPKEIRVVHATDWM